MAQTKEGQYKLRASRWRFALTEESIRSIADDEHQVESPADACDSDGCDLTNHGVEGEGHHHTNADTFRPSAGIEDLSRNDPGQWTAGG